MFYKKLLKNKFLKITIKIVVTFFCFYILYKKIDLKIIGEIIKDINYYFILLAVLFFSLSKYISAVRLKLLFETINLPISSALNLRLYLLGMYYNLFLPGGIGGDGYKAYYLKRKHPTISLKKIITSLLFDRINGLFVVLILILLFFLFLPLEFAFKELLVSFGIIAMPLLLLGLMYFFFKESIKHYFNLFAYSIGVQITQLLSVLFIILSLNIEHSIVELLFVFLLSTITVMIPITIGGSVLRELTFVYFSVFFHYDKNYSITIAFLFYIITALISLFGIYYSFNPKKLSD